MPISVDQLFTEVIADLEQIRRPESTYRLQFHAGFTFAQAARLTDYFHNLGITDCYASPFLKARSGSKHGYDITEHNQFNPEIGTADDFAAWVKGLHNHGMGLILDMVPNHMSVLNTENPWWQDVLENGPASPYAGFFDITWTASSRCELQGRILVPILGDLYGQVLEAQQLRLAYTAGAFAIHYYDHAFPVAPRSFGFILGLQFEDLEKTLGSDAPALHEYQSILTAIKNLPAAAEPKPELVAEGLREKEVIKRRLATLTAESPDVRDFVERNVTTFNGQAGEPQSFGLLEKLLDEQAYRLAYWRVAADEINYRRFFDVNELAALSMERPEVFDLTHDLVLRLLAQGKITGLRIDHPDGLFDPKQYLDRLQHHFLLRRSRARFEAEVGDNEKVWKAMESALAEKIEVYLHPAHEAPRVPLYVVVEKILGADEPLRADWPTHGTSGYEFLNWVNGLFLAGENGALFTRLYREWTGDDTSFADLAYRNKILIMQIALAGELQALAHQLDRLAQKNRWSRDFTLHSLRQALREIIACFPVYRSYIHGDEVGDADRKQVLRAVSRAATRNPAMSTALINFVRDTLLLRVPAAAHPDSEFQEAESRWVGKFQQVTSPVMAKGVEDTAFYVYNRLLSLNEVGGNPEHFGSSPASLHRALQDRQAHWPWALSATSTHDTKRSEDVRARLNVLSEMPAEWNDCLTRWSRLNQPLRTLIDEALAPDANEEYMIYQTLLGAWPLEPCNAADYAAFVERIKAYMCKALHEAKVHTSWINPNAEYDEAVQKFVSSILDPNISSAFLEDLRTLQKRISSLGMFNSLSQTLLKIAAPGVPDIYQGTELWDFSLVDPDNRRPVDFQKRQRMLNELQQRFDSDWPNYAGLADTVAAHKDDGRIKMLVTCLGLRCRRDHAGLFSSGAYVPLESAGQQRDHVFAFVRQQKTTTVIAAVPRLLTKLIDASQLPIGEAVWQDTVLSVPDSAANDRWRNIFTGEVLTTIKRDGSGILRASDIFARFPVALLLSHP